MNVGVVFLLSAWIANYCGAEILGVWTLINSLLLLVSVPALLGSETYLLRAIPEHLVKYSFLSAYRVAKRLGFLVLFSTLLMSSLLFLSSSVWIPYLSSKIEVARLIRFSTWFVIPFTFRIFFQEALRGMKRVRAYAFFQVLSNLVFMMGLLLGLGWFSYGYDVIYWQLISYVITVLLILAYLLFLIQSEKYQAKIRTIRPVSYQTMLSVSLPMLMTATISQLISQVDILMLGGFRDEAEVGIYGVVMKLSLLTSFILGAINAMAAPKFAELYHQGKLEELVYIARSSSKLIFWTTVPVLAFLLIFGKLILSFFGEVFVIGYLALIPLVLGQFVNSACGSVGNLLNMTGYQQYLSGALLGAFMLNIGLNLWMIPLYGLWGAGVASMFSMIFWNVLATWFLKKKLNLSIWYLPIIR